MAMLLPQIPTDNLYKFIFVFGIAIMFGSVLLYINQKNLFKKQIQENDLQFLEDRTRSMKDSVNHEYRINKSQTLHEQYLQKLIQRNKNNQKVLTQKQRIEEAILKDSINKEYETILLYLDDRIIANKTSEHRINYEIKHLKQSIDELNQIFDLSFIGFVFGFLMTGLGGYLWYVKVQKPMDERMKLEVIKLRDT